MNITTWIKKEASEAKNSLNTSLGVFAIAGQMMAATPGTGNGFTLATKPEPAGEDPHHRMSIFASNKVDGGIAGVALNYPKGNGSTLQGEPNRAVWKAVEFFPQEGVNVVVDSSHEYTYEKDLWARSFLPRNGYNAALNEASLTEIPANTDVLVIAQKRIHVRFSEAEIKKIRNFVEQGGSLLLIAGKGTPSATQLAPAFGINTVENVALKAPITFNANFSVPYAELPVINSSENWCFSAQSAQVAMKDATGKAVGVSFKGPAVGKGMVTAIPYYESYNITNAIIIGFIKGVTPANLKPLPASERPSYAQIKQEMQKEIKGQLYTWTEAVAPIIEAEKYIERFQALYAEALRSYREEDIYNKTKSPIRFIPSAYDALCMGTSGCAVGGGRLNFDFNASLNIFNNFSYNNNLPSAFNMAAPIQASIDLCDKVRPEAAAAARLWVAEEYQRSKSFQNIDFSMVYLRESYKVAKAVWIMQKLENATGPSFLPRLIAASSVAAPSMPKDRLGQLQHFNQLVTFVVNDMAGNNVSIDGTPLAAWLPSVGIPAASAPSSWSPELLGKLKAALSTVPKDTAKKN